MAFKPPGPGGIGSHIHGPYRTAKKSRPAGAGAAAAAAAGVNPGDPNAWVNSILNDPTYVSDLAAIRGDTDAARARRDAAVKALQFQYNDPSNPYATTAQLARQEVSDRANMIGDRAARGVLPSGGTKLQTEDIGYNYGKSLYDALNNVTGQIGSLDADLADQERQGVVASRKALDDATQSLISAGWAPSTVQAALNSVVGSTPGGAPALGGVTRSGMTWKPTPGGGAVSTGSFTQTGSPLKLPGARNVPNQAPIPFAQWASGLDAKTKANLASLGSSLAVASPGANPVGSIPNPDRPGFSANGSPLSMTAWKAQTNPFLPGFSRLGALR